MKALIIEDEKFVREYLTSLLRNEFDFDEIVQAVDGEVGWQLFEQQSFQFIILDLLLPKLDGIQLAKRILERGRGHRILAISSECDDFTVREVSRSGILGFVSRSACVMIPMLISRYCQSANYKCYAISRSGGRMMKLRKS